MQPNGPHQHHQKPSPHHSQKPSPHRHGSGHGSVGGGSSSASLLSVPGHPHHERHGSSFELPDRSPMLAQLSETSANPYTMHNRRSAEQLLLDPGMPVTPGVSAQNSPLLSSTSSASGAGAGGSQFPGLEGVPNAAILPKRRLPATFGSPESQSSVAGDSSTGDDDNYALPSSFNGDDPSNTFFEGGHYPWQHHVAGSSLHRSQNANELLLDPGLPVLSNEVTPSTTPMLRATTSQPAELRATTPPVELLLPGDNTPLKAALTPLVVALCEASNAPWEQQKSASSMHRRQSAYEMLLDPPRNLPVTPVLGSTSPPSTASTASGREIPTFSVMEGSPVFSASPSSERSSKRNSNAGAGASAAAAAAAAATAATAGAGLAGATVTSTKIASPGSSVRATNAKRHHHGAALHGRHEHERHSSDDVDTTRSPVNPMLCEGANMQHTQLQKPGHHQHHSAEQWLLDPGYSEARLPVTPATGPSSQPQQRQQHDAAEEDGIMTPLSSLPASNFSMRIPDGDGASTSASKTQKKSSSFS